MQLRAATTVALMFYDELRALNKARGIKDRGCCPEMKEYAAKKMVEDWFANDASDEFAHAVLELMEKPKKRRGWADPHSAFPN
jgi:non-homologous end joining protein Ku